MAAESRMEDLYDRIRTEGRFAHLQTPGIKLVGGIGSYRPRVMVVGEAPGATENTKGEPFCGASGRVLRQLMEVAGIPAWGDQKRAWLTNVVKFRPPGNRTPDRGEMRDAKPYLWEEWRILGQPRIIVAVGAVAWETMGPTDLGSLTRNAGIPAMSNDGKTCMMPMFHPAYGLRNPSVRETMEHQWETFWDRLPDELGEGITHND